MPQTPLFSVITVTRNSGAMVERALESLIRQTNKDWELVVIDGDSTPQNQHHVLKYRKHMSVFVTEADQGIYDAMNKGMAHAKGRFLYYLNADDYLVNNQILENVATDIISHPEHDLFIGQVIKKYPSFEVLKNNTLSEANVKSGLMPPHQGMFISRHLLDKLGGFSLEYRFAGDFELCCRLVKSGINGFVLGKVVAIFSAGGAGSDKRVTYREVSSVLKLHYGWLTAALFYVRKVILEQSLVKMLSFAGLHTLINQGTQVKMKQTQEKQN